MARRMSGADNPRRCSRAGLVRGSYAFARPAYPVASTAAAQARYYVRRLGTSARSSRTLPPALDLEVTGGLSQGALVTWAQDFLLTVRRLTGRPSGRFRTIRGGVPRRPVRKRPRCGATLQWPTSTA